MKLITKKAIIACFCVLIMIASAIFLPQYSNAKVGAKVKSDIESLSITQELTEKEQADLEAQLIKKNYKFVPPESFYDKSKNKDLSSSKVFSSEMNAFETPSLWKSMNIEQRVELSKIPQSYIENMTTDDLIVSTLNYNLLSDLFLYDSIQEGFDNVKKQFNGLSVLLEKKDSGSRLIELYKSIDLKTLYENDRFSTLRINFLEMILAQDEVIESLSEADYRTLVMACYDKIMQISETQKGNFGISTTLYLALKSAYFHDRSVRSIINGSKGLKAFITTGNLNMNEISDKAIGSLAKHFEKNYL